MQDHEAQVENPDNSQTKRKSKKKLLQGCGCGCLVVIIIVGALIYWGVNAVMGPVWELEAQGYRRVSDQIVLVQEDAVVKGPIVYLGQEVTIDGTVDGDVAALCQELTINGTINGDLDLLFCQVVIISETGVVTGNVTARAVQQMTIGGDVQGTITGKYQILDQATTTE